MLSPISVLGLVLVFLGLWLAFQMKKRTGGLEPLSGTVLRVDMEVTEGLDHKPVTVYVPVYVYQLDGETRSGSARVKLESCKLKAGDQVKLRYNRQTGELSPEGELRLARGIYLGVIGAGLLILFLVWLEGRGAL